MAHGPGRDSSEHVVENLYVEGNFAPVTEEVDASRPAGHGQLPAELVGRYLRNGPNPIGPVDLRTHHWFVGTGMVHGVRLRDGRAEWYRNRYVRGRRRRRGAGPRAAPRSAAPVLRRAARPTPT